MHGLSEANPVNISHLGWVKPGIQNNLIKDGIGLELDWIS